MKQRQPTRISLLPRVRSTLPMAAVFLAAALLFPQATPAQDQVIPENVAPVVGDVLKSGHYQTEIPDGKDAAGGSGSNLPDGNGEQSQPRNVPRAEGGSDPSLPSPSGNAGSQPFFSGGSWSGAGGVAQGIVYTVVAVLLVFLLVAIVRWLRGRRFPQRSAAAKAAASDVVQAVSTPIPATAARPAPLDRIEELAAAGDFEAAIHLMLLRALAALRGRLGDLPDSLTSREILRRSNLPREAAQPLSVIIGAVEVSYFGGRAPNAAVYRLCADNYRQFLGGAA